MAAIKKETKYTKGQLIKSKKYLDKVDLLNVLLQEDKSYSFSEVDSLINEFMKKEAK